MEGTTRAKITPTIKRALLYIFLIMFETDYHRAQSLKRRAREDVVDRVVAG